MKYREMWEKASEKYKVPKHVKNLVIKRTLLSRRLRDACSELDAYCDKIGLNVHHPLFDEAVLSTDVRIYCEEDAGFCATLEAIEAVLAETTDKNLQE